MKCPSCGIPNAHAAKSCAGCKADIAYVGQRTYAGEQFVFVEADPQHPIVVDAAEGDQTTHGIRVTEPRIFSRHEWSVVLAGAMPPDAASWAQADTMHLSSLARHRLNLFTIVTDRKIYAPGGEAQVFVVALGHGGGEVEVEVKLSGQRIAQQKHRLDETGLLLHTLPVREAGEYRLLAAIMGRPESGAVCDFTCAEFSLSPLLAKVASFEPGSGRVKFALDVSLLGTPYAGAATVRLLSDDDKLFEEKVKIAAGRVQFDWAVRWYGHGTLSAEIVTPDGNTATVAFPNSSIEQTTPFELSALDPPVQASLHPFPEAQGFTRGLHWARGREEDLPFSLESHVATEARIVAQRNARLVHVDVFDPHSGARSSIELRDVKLGQVIAFPVKPPYAVFTIGAFVERGRPFESWGCVLHPEELTGSLTAPDTGLPGDRIVVKVGSSHRAKCLLLVYDARLEHESPTPRLAECIRGHIEDATEQLGNNRVLELSDQRTVFKHTDTAVMAAPGNAAGESAEGAFADAAPDGIYLGDDGVDEELAEIGDESLTSTYSRNRVAELAHIELFDVEGEVTKAPRLGDQIGTWRVRAYLFRGVDWVELSKDVKADLPLFAEPDLPAIVGEGDEVHARVNYHTAGEATLVVTTPEGSKKHAVRGDGAVEVLLTRAGDVVAEISSAEHRDTARRTVKAPGRETVTASRVSLLPKGGVLRAKRVAVYPSLGEMLAGAIESLIRYPYG
ncbi:MAG: hypothetical protein AAB434_00915 [Planctomycetota bacterium]